MTFWWWVLLWVLLVLVGTCFLAWRAWRLWGSLRGFLTELSTLTATQHDLEAQAERLTSGVPDRPETLAVFDDVHRLRDERRALREATVERRLARREARRPAWARR